MNGIKANASSEKGSVQFSSVAQSCPTLCDPMDCSTQASLSITNSQSLLKLMSTEALMPSNHLILFYSLFLLPSIFSSIRVFPMSWLFATGGQTIGASVLVLPANISGLISFRIDRFDIPAAQGTLQESSPASQFKIINSSMLSLLYGPTIIYVHGYWKNHSFHYTEPCW